MSEFNREDFHKQLGELILSRRNELELSRRKLFALTGIAEMSIRKLEVGEVHARLADMMILDRVLGLGLAGFMERWSRSIEETPHEIEISGVKYRMVSD